MKADKKMELENAIDDLVSDICEKADEVRSNASISDDGDLFMLADDLRTYHDSCEKVLGCKSVQAVKKLRKLYCKE